MSPLDTMPDKLLELGEPRPLAVGDHGLASASPYARWPRPRPRRRSEQCTSARRPRPESLGGAPSKETRVLIAEASADPGHDGGRRGDAFTRRGTPMILASLSSSLIRPRPRTSRVRHDEEQAPEELQTVGAERIAADLESV